MRFELATPTRMLISAEVEEVVAPGTEGYFGVWPGHAPFLTTLGSGEVCYKTGRDEKCLAVSGGFAEVTGERVIILAETAELPEEIDVHGVKLLHLVDGTVEHAGKAYKTVRAELEAYGRGLQDKPEIVALNKVDALTPEQLRDQTARLKRAARKTPLALSAATGAGVRDVVRTLARAIAEGRHPQRPDSPAEAWLP